MKNKNNDKSYKMSSSDPEKLKSVEKKYTVSLEPQEITVAFQDKKFLEEFLDIVEKNMADVDLDIDTLCKKLLISRATIFRKIKKLTGETPQQFIQSYRLNRAAQLLRNDFGNVTEVAEAVGFSDQFYFSKCFKNKFGQPPKQYQLEHLKNRQHKLEIKQEDDGKRNGKTPQTELSNDFSMGALDRELIARGARMLANIQSFFKNLEGTPQRKEIFKTVIKNYELNSTLNEALKHFTPQELIQKIRQMIDDAKNEMKR